MSDLFKKITQGSIMLWNVEDEKKLPKIKVMGRLLGVTNFKYYKTDGYHSNFIRTLLRMRSARSAWPMAMSGCSMRQASRNQKRR